MASPTPAQLAAALNAAANEIPGDKITLYLIVVTPSDTAADQADLVSVCNTAREAERRIILESELSRYPPDN